jgi:hypothetical protein
VAMLALTDAAGVVSLAVSKLKASNEYANELEFVAHSVGVTAVLDAERTSGREGRFEEAAAWRLMTSGLVGSLGADRTQHLMSKLSRRSGVEAGLAMFALASAAGSVRLAQTRLADSDARAELELWALRLEAESWWPSALEALDRAQAEQRLRQAPEVEQPSGGGEVETQMEAREEPPRRKAGIPARAGGGGIAAGRAVSPRPPGGGGRAGRREDVSPRPGGGGRAGRRVVSPRPGAA